MTGSMELWLIQWPINQLLVSDLHGKDVSMKLHHDGNLGSLETSSGKSYELVSFAAQEPDATVFQPSGQETKAVGKISRRVCLVRYPGPEELGNPDIGDLNASSHRSAGMAVSPRSSRKNMSRLSGAPSKHWSSHGSAISLGQGSTGPTPKQKRKNGAGTSAMHSEMFGQSMEGSHAPVGDSNTSTEMPETSSGKSTKKKKVKE